MRTACWMTIAFTAAAALPAQTHQVRGKVEDVQGTANQFHLGCTPVPLVSTAVNLNLWIGQDALLDVVVVGTPASPTLRVDAIVAVPQTFEMGNLRFGQASSWTVFAPAGSFTLTAIDWTANTRFTPVPGLGAFVLGASPITLAGGIAGANNEFTFLFTFPNAPTYAGLSMTAQALILDPAGFLLSSPDCKVIGR